MTFPDACEMAFSDCENKSMNIGQAVKQTLIHAMDEGRIIHGAFSCAKLLEISPESVMLCILPDVESIQDVSIHIQHTLMEAYCLEHDIKILKVNNSVRLAEILSSRLGMDNNTSSDFSCVLIQYPKTKTATDEFVVDFCEMVFQNDVFPRPKIDLPV